MLIAYVNEASKGILFMFAVVEIFLIIYVIADLQPNYAKPIQNSITNTSLYSTTSTPIQKLHVKNVEEQT